MKSMSTANSYPAIAEVMARFNIRERTPFRGYTVLAVQHVQNSLVPLIDALCEGGADPGDITIVGKSYSTQPNAVEVLRERGIRVIGDAEMRDPCHSYEVELSKQVETVLDGPQQSLRRKRLFLVIDEGAVASRLLARRPDLAGRCRVVEQTTRGARWSATEATFPVVDVGRAAAKAEYEAPMVATRMMAGLSESLIEIRSANPGLVGVVGYGRMGAQLSAELARTFDVAVYDSDSNRVSSAQADGLQTYDMNTLLAKVDMLVGCTGSSLLGESDLRLLRRPVILANGASSDIEFSLWSRRREEAILFGSREDAKRPWRNHYVVDRVAGHVLLMGGFPLNFYSRQEPLSPTVFQITRALMFAGICQAVNDARIGLTPLNSSIQHLIADAYVNEVGGVNNILSKKS